MKNTFYLLTVLLFYGKVMSQDTIARVEKNIIGIQIGPLGAWVNDEFRLTNKIALRTEAGLAAGYWAGSQFEGLGFLLTPAVRIEPRWYYNLENRLRKGKEIKANRANFLTLQTSYYPNWFVIAEDSGDLEIKDQLSIIPTWGIRRTLGKHFDYEAGIGIGYLYVFKYDKNGYKSDAFGDDVVNIHLRIGYHF